MHPDRYLSGSGVPARSTIATWHAGHRHVQGWSRRRFLQTAAGAAVAGAAVGTGLLNPLPASAAAPGRGLPVPIPAGFDFFGTGLISHVMGPPPDDPSTVYNFEGASAITFVSGSVERTDRRTGEVLTLPYLFNDMRFMKGVFRGRDGHERQATFGFV
jgi:hypothetical protein